MNKILFLFFVAVTVTVYVYTGAIDKLGWIDDNTYRVSGKGFARENVPEIQRKPMACEAARLDAIASLLMKFAETGIDSVKGKIKVESFNNIVKKEFSGTVRGIDIIESIYYENKRMCKVVGEINEPNMRQKIARLAREHAGGGR